MLDQTFHRCGVVVRATEFEPSSFVVRKSVYDEMVRGRGFSPQFTAYVGFPSFLLIAFLHLSHLMMRMPATYSTLSVIVVVLRHHVKVVWLHSVH